MKSVYFVRHAQSDSSVISSSARPLTQKGLSDRAYVNEYFRNIKIDRMYSSPYRRASQTIRPLADERGLSIQRLSGFREWMGGKPFQPEEFASRMRELWADFSRRTGGCECLADVRNRALRSLNEVLGESESAVIGAHGLMLSVIIHHFYPLFGVESFLNILNTQPWIVKMYFHNGACAGMQFTDPLLMDMMNPGPVTGTRTYEPGTLKAYRYVVIFAKHKGKWVYCRAKNRPGFETAGGHIENGETPLQAAKRELFEETGAKDYDIRLFFDYAVDRKNEWANGQVFLAHIRSFDELPDYEMAEIRLMDELPEIMRFPDILPDLYARVTEMI